jgi:hypothetical protein
VIRRDALERASRHWKDSADGQRVLDFLQRSPDLK